MSADFNSNQLNNPKETLISFSNNNELIMAFLFQLVNIQIFPNDRLNVLIQFWDYAKKHNLEEIAYKLSNNMLSSIQANSENIIYGPQIASAMFLTKIMSQHYSGSNYMKMLNKLIPKVFTLEF